MAVDALVDTVLVSAQEVDMGSDDGYPEEAPRHRVRVDAFRLDRGPVTNRAFRRFVDATGYVTEAERPPPTSRYPGIRPEQLRAGSAVFTVPDTAVDLRVPTWWSYVPGACWWAPEGPGSDLGDRLDHPVVHVSHADASAYAAWTGGALPTEAQWEAAARAGGDLEDVTDVRSRANVWPGDFPRLGVGDAVGTTPVGTHPASRLGFLDLIGNVWEWTEDLFEEGHHRSGCCVPTNPTGPSPGEDPLQQGGRLRVLKGGSFLCAPNYCARYRPAARIPQAEDSSAANVGFRCVRDAGDDLPRPAAATTQDRSRG